MSWITLLITAAIGLAAASLLAYAVIRWLVRREPYASFARLRWRAKITFFRLLIFDNQVPWAARLLLVLVLIYLFSPISPIDLIPGIALDDVALALVALVAIVKMTPDNVVTDLIQAADRSG